MKLSNLSKDYLKVLNLVISGIPSIRILQCYLGILEQCFKPCYKRNIFNTKWQVVFEPDVIAF